MHHSQNQYKGLYFIAALIAAAVSVFLIELGGVGDSDYYWHIVLGREICSTHTIPVSGFGAYRDSPFMVKQHHSLPILTHFVKSHGRITPLFLHHCISLRTFR